MNMNKNILKKVFTAAIMFTLIAISQTVAQEPPALKTDVDKESLITELEKVISQLMEKAQIPGLSIALIRDGKKRPTR